MADIVTLARPPNRAICPGAPRYPVRMVKRIVARLPVFLVRVIGPSMEPGIRNGDVYVAHRFTGTLRPGQLIVLVNPLRPELLDVKRIIRPSDGGWWVEGDNADFSTDSRHYGAIKATAIRGVLLRKVG